MNDSRPPERRFNVARVLTGLVLIGCVTFGVAYYMPLSSAHTTLAREHQSLTSQQANLGAQLKLATEQLETAQRERDQLAARLAKISDAESEGESAASRLHAAVSESLDARLKRGELTVERVGFDTLIQIENAKLYRGHQVTVNPLGKAVLCDVVKALSDAASAVQLTGHSATEKVDNPILRADYPTTYELTAARAANGAVTLTQCGLDPKRITATGVGHYRPLTGTEAKSDGQLRIAITPVVSP